MKYFNHLFYLLIFLAFSCTDIEEIEKLSPSEFVIDGLKTEFLDKHVSATNSCNGHVVTAYLLKNKIETVIHFSLLKNGQLSKIEFTELDLGKDKIISKYFFTPDYVPKSTFNVTDFVYNENSKELSFSYEGTLFQNNDNKITKTLKGIIKTSSNTNSNCSIHVCKILFSSIEFNFNSISYNKVKRTYFNDTMEMHNHNYFSNDGYKLEILSEKDLWNLSIGEYVFEPTSTTKVSLTKYKGPLVVAQGGAWYDKSEWLEYETRGKITIVKKTKEQLFYKNIVGKIDMEIIHDNKVIYTIKDMEFNAGSFE